MSQTTQTTQTTYEFTQEGFNALVAKVFELEKVINEQNRAVSPLPLPGANDRNRSYSDQSSESNELSSLEEYIGDSSKYTQMPCKPKYGEIVCSALLDGWLIHGNTFKFKDMIKSNGGQWFGKCKGWALNNKTAVWNILKKINLQKKCEKVKNSFENLGLRFYKPNTEKKEAPKPLSDEEVEKENAKTEAFLNANTCVIDESDDDENFSEGEVYISDMSEEE